MNSWCEISYR